MRRIRILVAQMPRMLLDIVDSIVGTEPDMVIEGDYAADGDVRSAVRRADVDVLITGDGSAALDSEPWRALLYEHPGLKVLVLEQSDGTAVLYEMRPQRTSLGEISPSSLVDAIRAAARSEFA